MSAPGTPLVPEHLTPHDLVAYFRCPHEMELLRARHARSMTGQLGTVRTPPDVVPLRHSPLPPLPIGGTQVMEGRIDVAETDRLIYEDPGEEGLPVLFPPERVALDPRFPNGHANLIDAEFGLSGRPDLVIERGDGTLVPVEYKETHLFLGFHEAHGRGFDTVQSIAECRLVEAAFGRRPRSGIVLYGDARGAGLHEGWVEVRYGDSEESWLRAALAMIRSDSVRAPVPGERNCRNCEPNAEGLCRYAGARPENPVGPLSLPLLPARL
jgi:hypothetical protein